MCVRLREGERGREKKRGRERECFRASLRKNQSQFLELKKNTESHLGASGWFPKITVSLIEEKIVTGSFRDGKGDGDDFGSFPFLLLCRKKESVRI